MELNRLAWYPCLVLAVALSGACGDDGGTTDDDDGGTEETIDSNVPDNCGDDGETYFYVLDTLTVAPIVTTGGTMTSRGFDLDGTSTNSCVDTVVDYQHPDDASETGIDNQFGPLASVLAVTLGAPIDDSIAEQIVTGDLLLLVEVENADSLVDDECVTVNIYLGTVPGGGDPMLTGGSLSPGQTFNIDPAFLEGGMPAISQVGVITDGSLRVSADEVPIVFAVGDDDPIVISVTIEPVELLFDISASALTAGELGGGLNIAALVGELDGVMIGDTPLDPEVIEGVLTPYADLNSCNDISAAMLFTGVTAERGEAGDGGS